MISDIEKLVESVISQYKEFGISQATINSYQKGYYKPIILYCKKYNNGNYSRDVLESYLKGKNTDCANHKISKGYYTTIERAIRVLISVAETGNADFSPKGLPYKYTTTSEHMEIANEIIRINNVSKGSVRGVILQIRHFFSFVESEGISDSEITDETVFQFLKVAMETSKGCLPEIMRAVRLTTAYLRQNGVGGLRTNFSLLPYKKSTVHLIPPYSQEEIKKIVEAVDLNTPTGKRDYAIMLLAFDTGLRGIDILKLCHSDIKWRNKQVSIIQSKTGQPITHELRDLVIDAMADYALYVRPNNGEKELFLSTHPPFKALGATSTLSKIIDKYCEVAGVKKIPKRSFHSLRRAFATELSLKGIGLGEISELLGHRKIRSEKPYLSYNRSQIMFVAADFREIPINKGVYANILKTAKEINS